MHKALKWLTIAVSSIYLSIMPVETSRIRYESQDIGLFKKKPKESIENYIEKTDSGSYFDAMRFKLMKEVIESDSDTPAITGETYAVLLNGKYDPKDEGKKRFENNIRQLYLALKQIGIPEKNIAVVQDRRSGRYKNRFEPTISGLEKALSQVNSSIKKGDLLIFYTTNHGYQTGVDSIRYSNYLADSALHESDFIEMAESSPAGAVWMINATCNGYLVTHQATGKIIGHSFCGPDKNAVGGATIELSKTLNKATIEGSDVDINKDQEISIGEVATYTSRIYQGTGFTGILINNILRREVHFMTYQLDPNKVYIKK